MKLQKKDTYVWGIFLFTAFFYFFVAYNIPYTGDDWNWGSELGLQHLVTGAINSRYAGNLSVVIMTRSRLLQTLIMGTSYFALPFLMTKLVVRGSMMENRKQSALIFIAANCLLLSMDKQIWRQTYGWVSGFANYGISAVLILVYLHAVDPLFSETVAPKRNTLADNICAFLLGLVIQLFIENLALAMLILSVSVCVICYFKMKKISVNYLALLAGNALGLAIMFSSKIYPVLFQTGSALENVRELSYDLDGGLWGMAMGCFKMFSTEIAWQLWERNLVICCSISMLLVILFTVKCKDSFGFLEYALIAIDVLSIPYFVVFSHLGYGKYFLQSRGLLNIAEFIINVGFYAIVALQIVVLYRKERWTMWKLLIIWTGAPLVVLPLSAAVIAGGRFYITSNCFLILFVMHLLGDCLEGCSEKTTNILITLGLSVLLSLSMFYTFLYSDIGECTRQRLEIMEEAKENGTKEIVLPSYPSSVSEYIHWGDPVYEDREEYFRIFFGLAPDVKMTFVQE